MPKFVAKHRIEGVSKKPVEAGETFEAKTEDVRDMLAEKHGGTVKREEYAAIAPASSAEAKVAKADSKGELEDPLDLSKDNIEKEK